ncbi:hypothetical protein BDF21DRAFT_458719 [Thamnidium elegans]|uniref:Uncharacterized protein n=1 Tax=Thamnidium elegans TaxID=101142 RepID=A0A8H7SS52_9FUNG|nr:hypothetical protein INT48_000492 [Thamnidium elegans]KAI8094307.1 hypothetical protein BDF21DRAFT_458719 [Thamnidium elegans]
MTSIIGYTRVPFNSSSSKHFTIAPVKRLHQAEQQPALFNVNSSNVVPDQQNKTTTRRPTYHRMFSREMSQHGIIELIIDKKKNNTNKPINKQDSIISHYQRQMNMRDYNVVLSIDLNDSNDYNNLSKLDSEASFDNLTRLMDTISKIAQEKTIYFVNILDLLKKLQSQQQQHRFMSSIDKNNKKILVYFPKTISLSLNQIYIWLKHTIGIDVNKFTQWKLSHVEAEQDFLPIAEDIKDNEDASFDGESYFNDIHMFINHVDSLIESNGLFSHLPRNQEPIA